MTLEQLKSELKEKEKGCGTEIIDKISCGDKLGTFVTQWLCPTCQAEISALKKGISACEEALSQRNQEILEIIDKWETKQPIDQKYKMEKKGIFYNIYNVSELNLQELKQQLTEGEGKEWK